jgi:hypothetical protein
VPSITRADADTLLERARVRVSHGLFQNRFGLILQPGWGGERLSERDIVLNAYSGEPQAVEIVRSALRIWKDEVQPQLARLTQLPETLGFVPTPAWGDAVGAVTAASEALERALDGDGGATALERTMAFWRAQDRIASFLKELQSKFSDYFDRWDAAKARRPRES